MQKVPRNRALIALFLIVVAWIAWMAMSGGGRPFRQREPVSKPSVPADLEALETLRTDARQLHAQKKWCDAKAKWEQLQQRIEGREELNDWAQEVATNQQIVSRHCNPDEEMVRQGESVEVSESANGGLPLKDVSQADLRKHFPQGKTVRSIGIFDVTGRGSNKNWSIRGDAHFVYTSRVYVETKVIENTGSQIEFALHIPEVSQSLLTSDEIIQLAPIDSPILKQLWIEVEDNLLQPLPPYRAARRIAELTGIVDPNLKRSLTRLYPWFKSRGINLTDYPDAQLVDRVEELADHRVRLVYIPDIGVRTIEVLKGDLLPRDDVLSLAQNSGVLADYVVSQVLQTPIGKIFEVDVRDVYRMVGLNYDIDVQGTIKLKHEIDDAQGMAVMSVVGGDVTVEADDAGIRKSGRLIPRRGTVQFDPNNLIVTRARIDWGAEIDWVSKDHLMFETQGTRDLEATSHYEAEWLQ